MDDQEWGAILDDLCRDERTAVAVLGRLHGEEILSMGWTKSDLSGLEIHLVSCLGRVRGVLAPIGQVSEPLGQRRHDPKGSARASRSLVKGLSWKDVGSLAKEWVVSGLPSAKRMEADGLGAEIDLAADQAVGPEGIRLEGMPEQAHRAGRRGTPNENHDSGGLSLQIRLPRGRERTALGSAVDAGGGTLAVGADIASGALVEVGERVMEETRPNLRLPAPVEVFDGGLEAAFLRRGEDWNDVKSQARPHDPTEGIPTVVAALENGVVVELRVGRPPELPPVLHERCDGRLGGHQRLWPGAG